MSTTKASSEAPLEGGRRGLLRRRPVAGTPAAAARDRRRSKQRRRLANVAGLMAALDAATRPLTLSKPQDPLVVQAACRTEPGLIGAAVLALQGDADGA